MTDLNRRAALAGALGLYASPWAAAQGAFPSHPLKIVVPYAPGGTMDVVGRLLAVKLQDSLKQTVIVDNRPGASGVLGGDAVAKSPPDGHTLLLALTAIVQTATLIPKLPYDPYKDFAPVSLVFTNANVLVVSATMPVKTVADYVALVRSQPGKHSYGSWGNGSSPHMQGALLARQAGLDLVHVPYKGAAPMINDLLGGQLDAAFLDLGTVSPHVAAGKLRVLGTAGPTRVPIAPDVPTFTELGYKHFDLVGWAGIFVAGGTPAPLVAQLSTEIQKASQAPDVKSRLAATGQTAVGSTAERFTEIVRRDGPLYASLFQELGIKAE